MKGGVRRRNTANFQNLNGVFLLTNQEMAKIDQQRWQKAIKKAKDWEDRYAYFDGIDPQLNPEVEAEAVEAEAIETGHVEPDVLMEVEAVEEVGEAQIESDVEAAQNEPHQRQRSLRKCDGNSFPSFLTTRLFSSRSHSK